MFLLDTGYTRGGFCTLTRKRQKKRGFGEFLRGFAFTAVQTAAAALAQPGWVTFMDHPRGTMLAAKGWKTKPPQLQDCPSDVQHSSAGPQSPSMLPSSDLDSLEEKETRRRGGPSWWEGVRAAVVPEENPKGIHWIHPGWGAAPSTRKAMLGVQSVTNRSCSEVRSEPSLPKEQRKDKVLTNQGKSQNPVPAGATSVPKLPPSTSRPRGVRQHWGDALPSREGKERWGWDSTGSPRHSPGADPGWNSSSRSTHSSEV